MFLRRVVVRLISTVVLVLLCAATAIAAGGNVASISPVGPNAITSISRTEILFPVVGNTPGANGTHWRSDVVISNFRSAPQRILIRVLREDQESCGLAPIELTLEPYEARGGLNILSDDFMTTHLGRTGKAAVLVQAVTASGALDESARIDGFARIYTLAPGQPAGGGTMSESMETVDPGGTFVARAFPLVATGVRQDAGFRTNVGIVNMSSSTHNWRIGASGTIRDALIPIVSVPGCSMKQVSLPDDPASATDQILGKIAIFFEPGTPNTQQDFRWTAYASSVDNITGDAWFRQAVLP